MTNIRFYSATPTALEVLFRDLNNVLTHAISVYGNPDSDIPRRREILRDCEEAQNYLLKITQERIAQRRRMRGNSLAERIPIQKPNKSIRKILDWFVELENPNLDPYDYKSSNFDVHDLWDLDEGISVHIPASKIAESSLRLELDRLPPQLAVLIDPTYGSSDESPTRMLLRSSLSTILDETLRGRCLEMHDDIMSWVEILRHPEPDADDKALLDEIDKAFTDVSCRLKAIRGVISDNNESVVEKVAQELARMQGSLRHLPEEQMTRALSGLKSQTELIRCQTATSEKELLELTSNYRKDNK